MSVCFSLLYVVCLYHNHKVLPSSCFSVHSSSFCHLLFEAFFNPSSSSLIPEDYFCVSNIAYYKLHIHISLYAHLRACVPTHVSPLTTSWHNRRTFLLLLVIRTVLFLVSKTQSYAFLKPFQNSFRITDHEGWRCSDSSHTFSSIHLLGNRGRREKRQTYY